MPSSRERCPAAWIRSALPASISLRPASASHHRSGEAILCIRQPARVSRPSNGSPLDVFNATRGGVGPAQQGPVSRPARPPSHPQAFPLFVCPERRASTRVNSAPALLTWRPSFLKFACSAEPCTAQARLTAPHAWVRTGCPMSPEGVDPAQFTPSAAFTRAALVPSNACTSTSRSDTGTALPKEPDALQETEEPVVRTVRRTAVYPSNVLKLVYSSKSSADYHVKRPRRSAPEAEGGAPPSSCDPRLNRNSCRRAAVAASGPVPV